MTKKIVLPFKFYFDNKITKTKDSTAELFFDEHFEEIRQRVFQSLFVIASIILLVFINVKPIVQIIEAPVMFVKFFQSSPGEYFLCTLKISFYAGLLFSIPILLSQVIFFLAPGLTEKEKIVIIGLLLASAILLIFGLSFSYFVLIPAALSFFINYSFDIIEPLWSFDEYFSFTLVLFLSTGIIFQIPILQIFLSFSKIITGKNMLQLWKYVLLFSTILGAILTPSADPLTQLLLSSAIFALYLVGSFCATLLSKYILV